MKYRRWIIEAAILILVLLGVSLWQGRHLVSGAAPAFAAATIEGTKFTLAASDKPTLVYFWASWCPVCKLTSPNVAAVARDYRVVAVAMQSGDAKEIKHYLAAHELALPVVVADEKGALAARWGVNATPASFIVDGQGRIRFATLGYISTWGLRVRLWLASV